MIDNPPTRFVGLRGLLFDLIRIFNAPILSIFHCAYLAHALL
jgi:hypothetical protein